MTECNEISLQFQPHGRREIVAEFNGEMITSDAGVLLLREADQRLGLINKFAACYDDFRNPDQTDHPLEQLLAQRTFGIALGYEDLNDHDKLRHDPLLALACGCEDPAAFATGDGRRTLAGRTTPNRLELTPSGASETSRYRKIVHHSSKIEAFFVDMFLQMHSEPPEEIVLDIDATDNPLHGHQPGRFFHGYYGNYCYLPLYIFSGFCRESIMQWCEENDIDFVLGLAKNERLKEILESELKQAEEQFTSTGRASRVYKASRVYMDFEYQTLKSWSRSRRVIGKAEHLSKGSSRHRIASTFETALSCPPCSQCE